MFSVFILSLLFCCDCGETVTNVLTIGDKNLKMSSDHIVQCYKVLTVNAFTDLSAANLSHLPLLFCDASLFHLLVLSLRPAPGCDQRL